MPKHPCILETLQEIDPTIWEHQNEDKFCAMCKWQDECFFITKEDLKLLAEVSMENEVPF